LTTSLNTCLKPRRQAQAGGDNGVVTPRFTPFTDVFQDQFKVIRDFTGFSFIEGSINNFEEFHSRHPYPEVRSGTGEAQAVDQVGWGIRMANAGPVRD
uniref:hypothetical protein n=1 Tax=Yoonia sp. TaxID=2212373 RepID=UPI0040474B1C